MRELKPELKSYTDESIPSAYLHQQRSFVRIHWFDIYQYELSPLPNSPALHSRYFMLVEGDCLYSSATAVWWMVEHQGESYKMYGLSGVLTFPAFEKRGFGSQVVKAASDYILNEPDADMAILWTGDNLWKFYGQFGWEHMPELTVHRGDKDNPEVYDGNALMLFISQRAKRNRHLLNEHPLYIGPHSW